jgi:25S rRNA (cytosine2278-C5)-methyltransferase
MALYYDTAAVISSRSSSRGSLKSLVYDNNIIKSPAPLVYGLITECARWDVVLSEVIDNAGILSQEPKVCNDPMEVDVALLTDTAVGWAS